MLKAVLSSLKNVGVSFNSNALVKHNYFESAIPDTEIYLIYSLKFEIHRNKFMEYLKEIIEDLDTFDNDDDDEFLYEVLDISKKWYIHFLENKNLFSSNSSLKSELRKSFKKRIPDLKGFDRFYETVFNAIQEAYNIYTVVFYNPDAIQLNDNFDPDRNSCYINERPDYLKAIRRAKVYYTMIYKNDTPLTRVWFLCDEQFENAIIFNSYGHRFRNLAKLFGSQDELIEGDYNELQKVTGVYVNRDTVLTTTTDYNRFIYNTYCPSCGKPVESNDLVSVCDNGPGRHKLKCPHCANLVYSDIYKKYILKNDAVYSEYHKTYLYRDGAKFSLYLNSYIQDEIALYVWNYDGSGYTYIPKELTVYSEFKTVRIIKEQATYSSYYESYIPTTEAVYCDILDTYISKYDGDFIQIDEKYFPISHLKMVVPIQNYHKPNVAQYVGAWC